MKGRKEKNTITKSVNHFMVLDDDTTDKPDIIEPSIPETTKKDTTKQHLVFPKSSIEDEMFKQYYGRKVYKTEKKPFKKTIDNMGFQEVITVNSTSKKNIIECKFKNLETDVLELTIPNIFRVMAHHNDDQNWDFNSYQNICTLTKWKDIPRLFNTLDKIEGCNKFTDFDTFIMKNDISPLWEDVENRNGCICSIKVDSFKDAYNMLKVLLIYTANNTLTEFTPESWENVNGLSFSPKKIDGSGLDSSFCVIIKIWFKQNYGNNASIDKYLNADIQKLLSKYSVKVKAIKPEY
jgi:hypothetical protein